MAHYSVFQHLVGSPPKPKGAEQIARLQIQTSAYGLPIPLVYGLARVAGNLIYAPASDFAKIKKSGGRSSKWAANPDTYTYTAAIALGLCEGPITSITKIWIDKDDAIAFGGSGFTLFTGADGQVAWGYVTTNHPSDAVPYQRTAYIAHASWPLGTGAQMPNHTWEVNGFNQFNAGGGVYDCLPSAVALDFLTDAQHGAGFPSGLIGDWSAFATYVQAAGLFCSPVYSSQADARKHLEELMLGANTTFVWSDGKLKAIPRGDTAITANGAAFTPSVTPVYDLTDNDFLASPGTDPVTVTRTPQSDAFNSVKIEFENRSNSYNVEIAEAKDDAAINLYGLREAPVTTLHQIKDPNVARQLAQLGVQRTAYVRNTYDFTLPLRYALLEPMDIVTLTDAGLGLNKAPVRITEFAEAADGSFQVKAEDFPAGAGHAALYATQAGQGVGVATNVAPGNTTTPTIAEAPVPFSLSGWQFWIGASGGASWGGCEVWFSTDNSTFTRLGSIIGAATFGTLTATLASSAVWPAIDNTNTLAVDVTNSGGSLASVPASDFSALLSLCYVDGEFLAFQTAALTSGFHYNLTNLNRGLYNTTPPTSHAIGTKFLRCDDKIGKFTLQPGTVTAGQVVYFKFPAFNAYGGGLQSLASVSSVSYTVVGRTTDGGETVDQNTGRLKRGRKSDDGGYTAKGDPNDAGGTTLDSAVQTLDASGSTQRRALARGYQEGTGQDGTHIVFSPAFANPPKITLTLATGATRNQPDSTQWSTPASYVASRIQIEELFDVSTTATDFTIRAKLRQTTGGAANNYDFGAGNSLTAAGAATSVNVAAAPSASGVYTVRYNWSVSTQSNKVGTSRTATIVVSIRKRAGGSGGTPTLLRQDTYSSTDPDGTAGVPITNSGVTIASVSASLGATDWVEVTVTSFTHTGSSLGTDSCAVHGYVTAADGAAGVSFTSGSTDITTSMTPGTALVKWTASAVQ